MSTGAVEAMLIREAVLMATIMSSAVTSARVPKGLSSLGKDKNSLGTRVWEGISKDPGG